MPCQQSQAELAEIDENFVRTDLEVMEFGKLLLRRKEIYEMLHPETKSGISQANAMNRAQGKNVSERGRPRQSPLHGILRTSWAFRPVP